MRTEDLEALVVHAIVEHRSDEDLWYQLCKGTRTPQEVASIRRAHESPEALATKLVLFSPAPACVREATLRHLQREHASTSRSPDSTRTISEPVPLLEARRRRGGSVGTVLRVVVAIAAVVLLWRLARPGPETNEVLPVFDVEIAAATPGGMRGVGDSPPDARCDAHLRMDQDLHVRLRPREALAEPLAVAISATPRTAPGCGSRCRSPRRAPRAS